MKKIILIIVAITLMAISAGSGYAVAVKVDQKLIKDSYSKGYLSGNDTGFKAGVYSVMSTMPKDVSYAEVVKFVAQDRTNENKYDVIGYNCVDFSHNLRANALTKGIVCGIVDVQFRGNGGFGHSLNVFNTTDKGRMYVEPQNDVFVTEDDMSTGHNYFDEFCTKAFDSGMWSPYHGSATRNESYIDRTNITW